jgi:hypothetical protein
MARLVRRVVPQIWGLAKRCRWRDAAEGEGGRGKAKAALADRFVCLRFQRVSALLFAMGSGLSAQIQKMKKKEIVDLRKFTPLITELPPAIGQLQKAKELLLSENDLAGLPDEIGKLVNLEVLDVSKNRINSLPSTIGQMASLRVLNLADNKACLFPLSLSACSTAFASALASK